MSSKARKRTYAMSRRRRNAIFVVCSLLLVLLICLDHSPVRRSWRRRPKSGEKAKAYDLEKYHGKTFTVVKIVDGDTIDIDVPDGKYNHTRIRLWGIDTPETKSKKYGVMYFGPEAAEFAKKLALGKPAAIYLDKGNRTRGKYGRLLAYVQLPDGRFLNEVLVAEGFAYADLRFRHSFYHKYEQLQASARRQKKGLWPNAKREQLPEWLQRKKPNLLNK
jgi:micrococcal nuclease